jgi:RNA polymerase subunit RPABC4/transcription elongation factor Spt4
MAEDEPPVFVLACVSCGKTVSGSEAKCPRCGASFDDLSFECPFCGAIVSAGQSKCGECGTEFSIFAEAVDDAASVDLDGPASESIPKPEEAAEYECPACGKAVGEGDEECPHCRARFSE